jgi:hypothetical protein
LFGTTWVHVFEEDTDEGAVYRPEDADIPLSRRARERIRLQSDGSAAVLGQGADDRPAEEPATWHEEGSALIIQRSKGAPSLRIVSHSPSRLIVKSQSPSES